MRLSRWPCRHRAGAQRIGSRSRLSKPPRSVHPRPARKQLDRLCGLIQQRQPAAEHAPSSQYGIRVRSRPKLCRIAAVGIGAVRLHRALAPTSFPYPPIGLESPPARIENPCTAAPSPDCTGAWRVAHPLPIPSAAPRYDTAQRLGPQQRKGTARWRRTCCPPDENPARSTCRHRLQPRGGRRRQGFISPASGQPSGFRRLRRAGLPAAATWTTSRLDIPWCKVMRSWLRTSGTATGTETPEGGPREPEVVSFCHRYPDTPMRAQSA